MPPNFPFPDTYFSVNPVTWRRTFSDKIFILSVVRECQLEFLDVKEGENIEDTVPAGCGAMKACGVLTKRNLLLTIVKMSSGRFVSNILCMEMSTARCRDCV